MAISPSSPKMIAWRGFLTAHARVVDRLVRELEEEQRLPLTWYEVLLLLRESPAGRLRMHELAESRLLSRSAATRLIDRMERANLVKRNASTDDRRGTFVTLTPHGLSTLRSAAPVHLRGIEEHFTSHLDGHEAEAIAAAMGRIVSALEKPADG